MGFVERVREALPFRATGNDVAVIRKAVKDLGLARVVWLLGFWGADPGAKGSRRRARRGQWEPSLAYPFSAHGQGKAGPGSLTAAELAELMGEFAPPPRQKASQNARLGPRRGGRVPVYALRRTRRRAPVDVLPWGRPVTQTDRDLARRALERLLRGASAYEVALEGLGAEEQRGPWWTEVAEVARDQAVARLAVSETERPDEPDKPDERAVLEAAFVRAWLGGDILGRQWRAAQLEFHVAVADRVGRLETLPLFSVSNDIRFWSSVETFAPHLASLEGETAFPCLAARWRACRERVLAQSSPLLGAMGDDWYHPSAVVAPFRLAADLDGQSVHRAFVALEKLEKLERRPPRRRLQLLSTHLADPATEWRVRASSGADPG